MQRIRIGITGLACVFLVVLLAAAIVGFRSDDGSAMLNNVSAAGNVVAEPKDPLAELGVAPGGSTSSTEAPQSPAIQRPAGR